MQLLNGHSNAVHATPHHRVSSQPIDLIALPHTHVRAVPTADLPTFTSLLPANPVPSCHLPNSVRPRANSGGGATSGPAPPPSEFQPPHMPLSFSRRANGPAPLEKPASADTNVQPHAPSAHPYTHSQSTTSSQPHAALAPRRVPMPAVAMPATPPHEHLQSGGAPKVPPNGSPSVVVAARSHPPASPSSTPASTPGAPARPHVVPHKKPDRTEGPTSQSAATPNGRGDATPPGGSRGKGVVAGSRPPPPRTPSAPAAARHPHHPHRDASSGGGTPPSSGGPARGTTRAGAALDQARRAAAAATGATPEKKTTATTPPHRSDRSSVASAAKPALPSPPPPPPPRPPRPHHLPE
eukprot:gnl/Spiro4/6670_TR3442_c0_g1_i1.p1 gnl/Spiro4/6670_TR3442_c0_g1~~gnl/Spiro4/6670_TR3442_c0_g1_i1.p1  ORF type:complete len:353 (-),score=60.61 gnl/Spiro4/6670_TR3442_c0_g1_i1:186-1244(-)